MKTLYLDLNMGASGDMLMGALYELIEDQAGFLEKINSLKDLGVVVKARPDIKAGIAGTKMDVLIHGHEEESIDVDIRTHHHHDHDHNHDHDHDHDHLHGHHHHSTLGSVSEIIRSMDLDEKVKADAIGVYEILAQAEAQAHNMPVDQVHFHEVGSLDAIYDIVGVCLLINSLGLDKILASPIHLGSGFVKCAHGLMPVPAPATANILKGLPVYQGSIQGELCTPTGAALVKYFVDGFGPMPMMEIEKIGYGMGTKNFEAANAIRALLGTGEDESDGEKLVQLETSLDDITGEEVGFLYEVLFSKGALEVYSTNILMKKSRPGILLTVLVEEDKKDLILREIFKHSPTIGVKEFALKRHKLDRQEVLVETSFGRVRKKVSKGFGTEKFKYEYEDLRDLSLENDLSLKDLREKILREDLDK
ncbi:nickel pincer cofactor biosynthesis protein LarC [Neofamilia massiliensis]|uniref:nickel pincer cofactor biosynthesis protein LarC n=1 Tax=Neofamilia massiliensis TaxID=1673724 RepID=UPI0006BB8F1B|nr:nickel pincer cofactor biosynthesis protein LarC [Neofamilia massiliensis]